MPLAPRYNARMHPQPYPILEHDDSRSAFIEPTHIVKPMDISEHCVLCFFQDVFAGLNSEGKLKEVFKLGSEIGVNPVYEFDAGGKRVTVVHPGVGAPLAAAFLDELIALGCRKFIVCGGAGSLDQALTVGHLIVPDSAVRDEGTSYHYMPPSREVAADPRGMAAIEQTLEARGLPYVRGKTWTTDAIYRETPKRIAARRAEGCLTVEMEAATFFAVAAFRDVVLGQLLYGGDDLSGVEWDHRDWQGQTAVRRMMFEVSIDACLRL